MLSRGFKEQIYDVFKFMPETVQCTIFSATMPLEVLEVRTSLAYHWHHLVNEACLIMLLQMSLNIFLRTSRRGAVVTQSVFPPKN